jgi:hypothetical protein
VSATLRITDDGKVWETPLATFIEHNEGDDETCDTVRALPVGGSVVLGFGMLVERVASACPCIACALGVTDDCARSCDRYQGCRTPADALDELVTAWHAARPGLAAYDPRVCLIDLIASGDIPEGYIERSNVDWVHEIELTLRALECGLNECEDCRGHGCHSCDLAGCDATSVARVLDCNGVARCPRCRAKTPADDDMHICACGTWLRRSLERALSLSVRRPANDQPIAAE